MFFIHFFRNFCEIVFFYKMNKTFNSSNIEKFDAKNKNMKKIKIKNTSVAINSTDQINTQC